MDRLKTRHSCEIFKRDDQGGAMEGRLCRRVEGRRFWKRLRVYNRR